MCATLSKLYFIKRYTFLNFLTPTATTTLQEFRFIFFHITTPEFLETPKLNITLLSHIL